MVSETGETREATGAAGRVTVTSQAGRRFCHLAGLFGSAAAALRLRWPSERPRVVTERSLGVGLCSQLLWVPTDAECRLLSAWFDVAAMTECRAGDNAPGGDGSDPRRLCMDVVGSGVGPVSQRGSAASNDGPSYHVTDPRPGDAPTEHEYDSNAAQVDSDQTQVLACAQSAGRTPSPPAPAQASDSTSRPASVRTNRRFTVTKLVEGGPSSPKSDLRLPPAAAAAAPAPAPAAAAATAAAAPATAADSVEADGWDYGPTTDTTVATTASTASTAGTAVPGLAVSAAPTCSCSQSVLPPPAAAAPAGRARLVPYPAPVAAGLPAGVLTGLPGVRPVPGAPAGHYATLQPGIGGVPPSAFYHQTSRQPLLATGHSATLAAGLASSVRLQQALQSRLAAGGDSIHPRLQPSHPLYRQLASADYNPSHTISYGHSDGRQLTVRRLLDWELPDLHTVRKYTR